MNLFQSNMHTSILVLLIVLVAILSIIIFFMRKNISTIDGKLKLFANEFLAFRETTAPLLNIHYAKNKISSLSQDGGDILNDTLSPIPEEKVTEQTNLEPSNPLSKDEKEIQDIQELVPEDEESDYIGETDDDTDDEEEDINDAVEVSKVEELDEDPEINEIEREVQNI